MSEHTHCTVGVDIGDRTSMACLDSPGVPPAWFAFRMTREGVRDGFAGHGFGKIALEVGAQSGWVSRQ